MPCHSTLPRITVKSSCHVLRRSETIWSNKHRQTLPTTSPTVRDHQAVIHLIAHHPRPSASRHHRTSLGCAPSPPLRWHCDLEVGTFMRTGNIRRYSNHSWHVHGQANISCENTSTHHQFIHFTQFITMLSDSFWSNQIYIVILAAGENRRPTGSQPAPTDTMKLDLTRFWNQALVLPAFDRIQVALSRLPLLCLDLRPPDLRPPAFWCALGRKILA